MVLCLATPVIGQRPAMQNRNPVGVVEGYIFDKAANKPLEFASISLFRQKDSTLATGAITDNQGHYLIKEVPFGHYYIVADFIGYKKIQTNHVMIRPDKLRHDAGKIFLEPTAQNLSGVEITAEKNRLEYKIDRKVINVSQDINAQGGTAVDVLENTPSVEVDIEGNVSLRGSESFKVYIDGKPSVLEGNDLLKQLPANTIEQIEIITNPSVKYDPDGSGGIINVKMKKQKNGALMVFWMLRHLLMGAIAPISFLIIAREMSTGLSEGIFVTKNVMVRVKSTGKLISGTQPIFMIRKKSATETGMAIL